MVTKLILPEEVTRIANLEAKLEEYDSRVNYLKQIYYARKEEFTDLEKELYLDVKYKSILVAELLKHTAVSPGQIVYKILKDGDPPYVAEIFKEAVRVIQEYCLVGTAKSTKGTNLVLPIDHTGLKTYTE